jgi:trehalose synthase
VRILAAKKSEEWMNKFYLPQLKDYEKMIDKKTVRRIMDKAKTLSHLHIVHINSTYYGGGVAQLLSSLTLLMNAAGIKTGWRVIQGSPDFFSVTKKMHNAMQGGTIRLTVLKRKIYEKTCYENSIRNHLDHDIVVIHDPQPLPMIEHYDKKGPWVWQCHVDLSAPYGRLWGYLSPFAEKYDAVIMSLEEYRKKLKTPQVFFMPAIDPFSIINKPLTDREINERLEHYKIPEDLPLVVQISRFDKWKDPEGVIKAFKIASRYVKARLLLLGNIATDDPEGEQVYKSLLDEHSDRIMIISAQDTALVNALQRRAAVILQKSLKEGFGLTVAEAMWKGAAVIGGNVGGIKHQIKDGYNGFLVDSIEEAADKIARLIDDKKLRSKIGKAARESVKKKFLMPRLLEDYLDLFASFKTKYALRR